MLNATEKTNACLDALKSHPDSWVEYCCALHDLEANEGLSALSEAEQYVLSAYQLDSCIQSSGLFSYFELQTAWAAKGVQATGVLGLTGLNQMLVRALSAMSLPSDATEAQIAEATRRLVGESEEFAGLLDHFEQLEDDFFYQADAPVADAIVSFAVINHDALLRAET